MHVRVCMNAYAIGAAGESQPGQRCLHNWNTHTPKRYDNMMVPKYAASVASNASSKMVRPSFTVLPVIRAANDLKAL